MYFTVQYEVIIVATVYMYVYYDLIQCNIYAHYPSEKKTKIVFMTIAVLS